jgi:hypothetical protein
MEARCRRADASEAGDPRVRDPRWERTARAGGGAAGPADVRDPPPRGLRRRLRRGGRAVGMVARASDGGRGSPARVGVLLERPVPPAPDALRADPSVPQDLPRDRQRAVGSVGRPRGPRLRLRVPGVRRRVAALHSRDGRRPGGMARAGHRARPPPHLDAPPGAPHDRVRVGALQPDLPGPLCRQEVRERVHRRSDDGVVARAFSRMGLRGLGALDPRLP